jgi:two-component system, OmpR family, alkaline phosphatase synthesis response regulator PhoP
MSKRIFVVEDDLHIQELVRYNLTKEGYIPFLFTNAKSLFESSDLKNADLFILDIMLPGEMDGYQICRNLKENKTTKKTPVIFLTAKSEEFDAVLGLELGAEDYVKKPFGIKELMTRIKVIMRRNESDSIPRSGTLEAAGIKIDLDSHLVYKDGGEVFLPLKEFELLKILMENSGRVMSRDLLLEKVWGFEYLGETRTVDVHVRYLRQKIEYDDKNPKRILTVRGIGYKFSDDREK